MNIKKLFFLLLLGVIIACSSSNSRGDYEFIAGRSPDSSILMVVDTTTLWDGDSKEYYRIFLDKKNVTHKGDQYSRLDTFRVFSSLKMSRDGDHLTFIHCDDTCCFLISVSDSLTFDTLLYDDYSNKSSWLKVPMGLEVNVKESLIVVQDYFDKDTLNLFYVLRIKGGNKCDTLISLREIYYPVISPSGEEIFFGIHAYLESGKNVLNVGIYDVIADSIVIPFRSDYSDGPAYRPNKQFPIVFLRRDSIFGMPNLCMFKNDSGVTYLTNLSENQGLGRWNIVGDSVQFVITSITGGTLAKDSVYKIRIR